MLLNNKEKPFVVCLFSLIAIGIFILITLFANFICHKWYGLIVGVLLMLSAIPFHIFGKKNKIGYYISFFLNTVGSGFSASAYYVRMDVSINLYRMVLSAVPAIAILLLVYIMFQTFRKTKKITLGIGTTVNLLFLVSSAVLWVMYNAGFFSFCFFCLLISLFYLCVFGITLNHEERFVLRDISFGSFGSFIIITVVVICILSEGEILESLDIDLGRKRKRKGNS